MERLISLLVIATGGLAASVGVLSARRRLWIAQRAHKRIQTLYATIPEDWNSWFLGGFASLTMGTRWLWAGAAWLAWTIAGMCLIGLGIQLW